LGKDGATAPNGRIVLGFVGVGNMGTGHVRAFSKHDDVQIVGVCDVRQSHRDRAKGLVDARYGHIGCSTYSDFRELLARPDLDAVVIAVPDHWHALVGIEAARRGKAMYYEKPMGVSVAEAQAVRRAVRRYGVVFQFGTQQRSSENFRLACELVRNGRIGRLETIMIGSASHRYEPDPPTEPVPPGFDYDTWLGPAPWVPYAPQRCTRDWTLIYDYSLGCVGGAWGIHDVDIAQWANDSESTGPIEVEGTGVFTPSGLFDTATAWEVEHTYANGVKLIHMDMRTALKRAEPFRLAWMGTLFQGSEGWIYISRRGLFTHPESLRTTTIGSNDVRLPESRDHRRNFLDAVKTGKRPVTDVETAVCSEIVCQQADVAMRLRRRLRWDPVEEVFVGDDEANRMLSRAMRSPWRL
jgi:predicted dehydrogenase